MRSIARLVGLIAALEFSTLASAASLLFDESAFNKAVAEGGPVIVQFHADWCPTCKEQAPIVAEVLNEPKLKSIKFFIANFDTEKA